MASIPFVIGKEGPSELCLVRWVSLVGQERDFRRDSLCNTKITEMCPENENGLAAHG